MTQFEGEYGSEAIEHWNRVFRCAAAQPRRQLIASLLEATPGESVLLPEAAVNPNLTTDLDSLRIELYHQHLPLLAEWGFVEWDTNPLAATHGPRFEEIAVLFETLQTYAEELPPSLVNGFQETEAEQHLSSSD